jgi:hypothetical protein
MFSFLVHTLFALQGSTKINGSYSLHHLSGASLLSPTFINVKPQKRDALFASPRQQSEIIDESESLDWLQKRLGLHDEQSIALAKRFPDVHTLSVEEQLAPRLDWLQQRIGLSNEELGELVRRQPTILDLSIQDQLGPNISWLQHRLQLDSESLPRVVLRLEPTMKFYEECVGLDAARSLIANNARLLGSSLEKLLKPRLAECQEAGIPIDKGAVERMSMLTEKKWSTSMAFQNTKLLKQQLLNR